MRARQSSVNDGSIACHQQETLAGGAHGWPEGVRHIMLCAAGIGPYPGMNLRGPLIKVTSDFLRSRLYAVSL